MPHYPGHTIKTILLIEDDREIIDVTTLILEYVGWQVQLASDDETAWNCIHTQPPHLVLMDITSPGHDAKALTYSLKHEAATQHIPVVFFSAAPDIGDVARQAEADDYIPKPFELDLLVAKIKHLLPD